MIGNLGKGFKDWTPGCRITVASVRPSGNAVKLTSEILERRALCRMDVQFCWCTGLESEQELLQKTKDEGGGRKGLGAGRGKNT